MKKHQYWQMVRGVCILAVIMIRYLWLGIRQIINFPVTMFIFMAGYFVNPSQIDRNWLKIRGAIALTVFDMEPEMC